MDAPPKKKKLQLWEGNSHSRVESLNGLKLIARLGWLMDERRFRKRKTGHGALALTALLALAAVALFVAGNKIFIVRQVTVEGNTFISAEEILRTAGISLGDSMLTLDTAAAAERINAHQYLQLNSIWRSFPDRLFINVTELSPVATTNWMGSLLMLGSGGIVMEITGQIDIELNVPVITGASIKSARVGEAVEYSVAGQGDAIAALLDALDWQDFTGEISEINVASLDDLYLVTRDGLIIRLGEKESLDAKIALVRAALAPLRAAYTVRGAVLDVSTGQMADFRPR